MNPLTLEVFEEIRRRQNSRRPERSVTKLGLVVEGGAVRGAVSMAFLAALERSQLSGIFDRVFAESSGAVNAAYFLAGQAEAGLELYRRAVHAPPLRLWRLGRQLDLDAVFKPIVSGELALNCERVRRCSTRLQVSLTDASNGAPVTLPLTGNDQRIYTILRAGCALVPFYNRSVHVDGRDYVDGGIADPVPVLRALEAGCSHVLVLLTRPREYQPRRLHLWEHAATRLLLASWVKEFRNVFHRARQLRYNRSRAIALGAEAPSSPVFIAAIAPPANLGRIDRFLKDPRRLRTIVEACSAHMEAEIASWETATF